MFQYKNINANILAFYLVVNDIFYKSRYEIITVLGIFLGMFINYNILTYYDLCLHISKNEKLDTKIVRIILQTVVSLVMFGIEAVFTVFILCLYEPFRRLFHIQRDAINEERSKKDI